MKPKMLSVANLGKFFAALATLLGLIILAGCNSGSNNNTTTPPPGTPAVTLSGSTLANNTLTFTSAAGVPSSPQSVTVTNSGTATLNFTTSIAVTSSYTQNNTCGTSLAASGTCTISVIFTPTVVGSTPGTLTITDNASPSTQTVTLSGTGSSVSVSPTSLSFQDITVGTTSAVQPVTLNNAGSTAVAITFMTAAPFAVATSTNPCGASIPANSSCTIGITFSPTAAGTSMGSLTITDTAGTQTVSLTGSNIFLDQTQVTVGFGINGNTNNPDTNYYNGIFTTVIVCTPGTTTCVNVPNVLVDTGSVGLRVLSSALTGVTLNQINDTSTGTSYPLYECVEYGDLSYTWGPMEMATVQVGGEIASQVPTASGGTANTGIPIQVIAAGQTPPPSVGLVNSSNSYYNSCLYYSGTSTPTNGNNDDATTTLGANGILGVGNFPQDCSVGGVNSCASQALNGQYLICQSVGSQSCDYQTAAVQDQAWNPVAAFPSDNNGVSISLPTIPSAGTTTVTGTLTFGIGTASNNGLNGATIYGLDGGGNFASATFNGFTLCTSGLTTCPSNEASGGTFIDSGSNAYFVADAATLNPPNTVSDCTVSSVDIGYYCPSSPLSLQLGLTGSNGASNPNVTLPIESATTLFTNTSYAAFNDLGGPSCTADAAAGITCGLANDYFDLGLPFFFGQPEGVFVGISGTSLGGTMYTNGYWAF